MCTNTRIHTEKCVNMRYSKHEHDTKEDLRALPDPNFRHQFFGRHLARSAFSLLYQILTDNYQHYGDEDHNCCQCINFGLNPHFHH